MVIVKNKTQKRCDALNFWPQFAQKINTTPTPEIDGLCVTKEVLTDMVG